MNESAERALSILTKHPRSEGEIGNCLPPAGTIAGLRPLTYLACPYSSTDPKLVEWRSIATKATAWLLMNEGWNVFSPITHSHPLHKLGDCRGDWKFWEKIDREFLGVSQRMIVLLLEGWKASVGVQAEIDIAKEQGIKISYLAVCKTRSSGRRLQRVAHSRSRVFRVQGVF